MPRGLPRRALALCFVAAGNLFASTLVAQTTTAPAGPQSDSNRQSTDEVVITGDRRSAVSNIAPLLVVDEKMIAATGATSMAELLRIFRGALQSADGSDPIFLINAQRVSGYDEIGTLPPEAIEKWEIFPEQQALKFGYPPTRRVLNVVTKRRFRQIEVKGTIGTTTRGGSNMGNANFGLTRLHDDSRLTVALEYRHTDPVSVSDRHIVPDPDILFDAIGNVTGIRGGEIDPGLSARAGHVVTVAAVPGTPGDRTLGGFAAGADRPRAFDLGDTRTLFARNDAAKGNLVFANRIGATMSGSVSLSAETSRDRNLLGPARAILAVPRSSPYSPFAGPVLLNRYLTEVAPLSQAQTTTTIHAGATLRGAISGWRWDLTGALDQQNIAGRNERSIDLAAANATIASGADPFAPFAPSLLSKRLIDRAKSRTRTAGTKAVATNNPVRLPAGKVSLTITAEAERATAASHTRGPSPFDLHLARTRIEGGIALDIPLTSRREGFLPLLGELSVNASANAKRVGGFGTLYDSTFGVSWGVLQSVQLLATVKNSEAAAPIAQLSSPVYTIPDLPFFDFRSGRTEIVTLTQGGSPELLAEHRRVRSLGLNLKPFKGRNIGLNASYDKTTIRNQTGTVYAVTDRTEAILPDLFVRDANGRLTTVTYRPINFYRETTRSFHVEANAYGAIGKPRAPNAAGPVPERPHYYSGIGPTLKLADRLQLRPGAPILDVLKGDTILGFASPRLSGYFYGGIDYMGTGLSFDGWYQGAGRMRSPYPASDLHFSSIFKLNVSGQISIHHYFPNKEWTRHSSVKLEVSNITDFHQRIRDGNGVVPNRFQADYTDPIGRTVKLTLRKLF